MGKILAFDIGGKRTGVAETDPLGMMAFPLETIATTQVVTFLQGYLQRESVEVLVVGEPRRMHGELSDVEGEIQKVLDRIAKAFPQLRVVRVDERFTSKLAADALLAGGMKKAKRQEKGAVDKVAAALILENFLAQR